MFLTHPQCSREEGNSHFPFAHSRVCPWCTWECNDVFPATVIVELRFCSPVRWLLGVDDNFNDINTAVHKTFNIPVKPLDYRLFWRGLLPVLWKYLTIDVQTHSVRGIKCKHICANSVPGIGLFCFWFHCFHLPAKLDAAHLSVHISEYTVVKGFILLYLIVSPTWGSSLPYLVLFYRGGVTHVLVHSTAAGMSKKHFHYIGIPQI